MAAPQSMIETHVAHLEGWVKDCNENHGDNCHAGPIAGRPQHHIPDWVIDTEDGCIVPGDTVQRYVALSYVWSPVETDGVEGQATADERLMLQKDNLADFCRQGFLHSGILERAPIVIQDAINLVKLSGSRYLWVDSLCIVQHDDTTMDRVGLMNEIYSGAYFTVIAAASTQGLYGDKHYEARHLPREFSSVRSLHNKLLCSHWASRGWTFQEHLLSKRSMIFLDDVCFWDCQDDVQWPHSTADEDTDSSVGSNAPFQVQQPPSITQHPFEKWVYRGIVGTSFPRGYQYYDLNSVSPVPDLRFYIELACRYSNRNLTYDQDVLPAFSGVLEALSRRSFRGGFICGLPALFLDSALLWQPLLKARRRCPAQTATKIAPMAPLPSWSWAGWQCLIDPDSLRGGLDYMVGRGWSDYSWATWKLVDWSTISDDCSVNPVDEPALLQRFKTGWKGPNPGPLPPEWSRRPADSRHLMHATHRDHFYEYPLPTQDACSAIMADRNISLLSCMTKQASLRVRRVLVPYCMQEPMWIQRDRAFDISVFNTDLYNFEPKIQELCPVVTLEDDKGRWAGAMTIMEDAATIQPGSQLEMIAISTGSAFYPDIDKSYPERIDGRAFWKYERNSDEYHFRPLGWHDGRDNSDGVGNFSAEDDTRQSLDAGIDVGPFARMGVHMQPEDSDYHFYNVLWVETIEGVMYRKAAGRVRKEIWDLNCGETVKVVLG